MSYCVKHAQSYTTYCAYCGSPRFVYSTNSFELIKSVQDVAERRQTEMSEYGDKQSAPDLVNVRTAWFIYGILAASIFYTLLVVLLQ